jgi:hypothetical protein
MNPLKLWSHDVIVRCLARAIAMLGGGHTWAWNSGRIMSTKVNPKKLEEGTDQIQIPLSRISHMNSSGIEPEFP